MELYCLCTDGNIRLEDYMRTLLLRAAKAMADKNERKAYIRLDDFAADIETDYRYTGFGCIYGILFTARVYTPKGDGKVEYIARVEELNEEVFDNGFWAGVISVPGPPPEVAMLN